MTIFFTIGAIGFMYVLVTSMFGHDHDHDVGHDIGHGDLGHDAEHGDGHITSVFSTRVIAIFLMGFGGTGGVARFYEFGYPMSCLFAAVVGILFGAAMFYLLEFFAKQQANSLFSTESLVGCYGTVEVPIEGEQPGQVAVSYRERYNTYTARSKGETNIAKGTRVRVVGTTGSDLTVEKVVT